MIQSINAFYSDAQAVIDIFSGWSKTYAPRAVADHICYKCSSYNEFITLRSLFEIKNTFIYQVILSDRRVATIKLPRPIITPLGDINFLELSDQKPDHSQTSGFHHIEIYPPNISLEQLVAELERRGLQTKKVIRPHHTTYDCTMQNFIVRLEAEALIEQIKSREMD